MNAIKAVLFDLDGTLLDRDSSLAAFAGSQYDRLLQHTGVGREKFRARFVELDDHGYVWKDKVYRQLAGEFRLPLPWKALFDDYLASFRQHCVGFPNLTDALSRLKSTGLKLGIVSNGFTDFQMNNIRALGIEHYFDAIVISEKEGLRKPDPAIFRLAADRLGVDVTESIYAGDHPLNDVEAARKAGMRSIWKETPCYAGEFPRDGEIGDLPDIIRYL